jgi:hypothetical protein
MIRLLARLRWAQSARRYAPLLSEQFPLRPHGRAINQTRQRNTNLWPLPAKVLPRRGPRPLAVSHPKPFSPVAGPVYTARNRLCLTMANINEITLDPHKLTITNVYEIKLGHHKLTITNVYEIRLDHHKLTITVNVYEIKLGRHMLSITSANEIRLDHHKLTVFNVNEIILSAH